MPPSSPGTCWDLGAPLHCLPPPHQPILPPKFCPLAHLQPSHLSLNENSITSCLCLKPVGLHCPQVKTNVLSLVHRLVWSGPCPPLWPHSSPTSSLPDSNYPGFLSESHNPSYTGPFQMLCPQPRTSSQVISYPSPALAPPSHLLRAFILSGTPKPP